MMKITGGAVLITGHTVKIGRRLCRGKGLTFRMG